MEADWEVEIGGDAAVIEAAWDGFLDLRQRPELVNQLSECVEFLALGRVLGILNGASSVMWSSKCDVWLVENFSEFDRDEFAANEREKSAVGCYIDLLPRDEAVWDELENAVKFCRVTVENLRGMPLRAARVELVIRQAYIAAEKQTHGITAYVTGVGERSESALMRLGDALDLLTLVLSVR